MTMLSTLSYPLRHPIVTLIVVILFLYATFFTALQLSPAAQRAFNNAVQSYGYATASVVLSSVAETALVLVKLENVELKKSAYKKQLRLDQFRKNTAGITKRHNIRMNKLIAKTAASNIFSFVPVVGDMAGIALAIDATVELCSMFKELESTSITYGLDLHLYTDTTCEKSDLIWEGIIRQAEVRKKYWADFMRWLLE
ncbi:MAG TPA: hypothetical protein EYQ14_03115 [Gammaproteobacteria bacterium]|nr:hypothetical protein [Gammaproteobacteria bacterium]